MTRITEGNKSLEELTYTAMHPTRLKILSRLENEPTYATKLEDLTGIDRKIVSFHLSVLERNGLLTSKFGLQNDPPKRPTAVRYYTLTPRGSEVLKRVRTVVK